MPNLQPKRATGQALRAMALAKTGHGEEGMRLLLESEKTMAPYFEHYEGAVWWDIVFCKIALDEAHSLLSEMASVR